MRWWPESAGGAIVAVVAAGGALGSAARYGLGVVLPDQVGGFPWTTFAINVTGCLAIGLLTGLPLPRVVATFLGAGVLGGYTTMSTYADQARALLVAGEWGTAAAYVGGTLSAALIAVHIGLRRADR